MPPKIKIAALLQLLLIAQPVHAAITLDGTLGRSGAITGPNFAITPDLGKQVGTNLFHSFSKFDLVKGDIATFSGTTNVSNIISRVTGGSASSIDGTLKSTIAGASMYFLNPVGVIFGPNASLDISGSFHVSTADYLKLGTDGRFDAATPANSVLTVSPPSAFGFVATKPAGITVSGAGSFDSYDYGLDGFGISSGNSFSIIGGDISITSGIFHAHEVGTVLNALGSRVNIASVASPGEVVITNTDLIMNNFSALGNISIDKRSFLTLNAEYSDTAGDLFIRGNNLTINNSFIETRNENAFDGGSVDIRLAGNFKLNANAYIAATGSTSIKARTVEITNGGYVRSDGEKNISIDADHLVVSKGGIIANEYSGENRGGSLTIKATDSILLSGNQTRISTASLDVGNAGSISLDAGSVTISDNAKITSLTDGDGSGGNVTITTGTLKIENGGLIAAKTLWAGNAGNITITARDSLSMSGALDSMGEMNPAYIWSYTQGEGNAGSIFIDANNITMKPGSTIKSNVDVSTGGSGIAGNIYLHASDTINISGVMPDGKNELSVVSSGTDGGNAGNIVIDAPVINLDSRADITTAASNTSYGDAGTITLKAQKSLNVSGFVTSGTGAGGRGGCITLESPDITVAGIVRSNTTGSGEAGNILITTGKMRVVDGGSIDNNTTGSGNGGTVELNASESLVISGSKTSSSAISSTTRYGGNAGLIKISAPRIILEDGGAISSSSYGGSGNAGTIEILASDSIEISGHYSNPANGIVGLPSSIRSETFGSGTAGDISVTTGSLTLSKGGKISTDTQVDSSGNAGNITIAATGRVTISGDYPDIVGDMSPSSISSETYGTGKSGNITLHAKDLTIAKAGLITTSAASDTADAGDIAITTDSSLIISGYWEIDRENIVQGGITSDTYGSGKAGNISISSPNLNISDVGLISTSTFGTGQGGDLSVKTASLTLSGKHEYGDDGGWYSSISSDTWGSGPGGNVNIQSRSIMLTDGALISSESLGTGKAGNLDIKAVDSFKLIDSSITTATANADGGSISIDPVLVYLKNSSITTSVKGGTGNGGNIDLTAKQLVLDNSRIVAQADAGNGGNININSGVFIQSLTGSLISASSNLGLQGSVVLSSPVLDVNAALVEMPSSLRDIASLSPRRCITTGDEISSFVVYACGASSRQPDAAIIGK